ncbi:MAG TPA: glycosyltransferase [Candidatus Dormibacteraeota bacterium]|jgi:GT2 family glycosyltransferase|nr:glycosyltransferase [Candidatus Dormibacteraeota bacterium]
MERAITGAMTGIPDDREPDAYAWAPLLRAEREAQKAPSVTGIVQTLNEEALVEGAVRNLAWCDEVLVVDMHSDDRTAEIARSLGARVEFHERLSFVEPARMFALEQARNDWILVIDPDERVTESLARELVQVAIEDSADAVRVPRDNWISGRRLRATGWGAEKHYRFFKRGHVFWPAEVHAIPQVSGRTLELSRDARTDNTMHHYTAENLYSFFEKLNRYSEQEPANLRNMRRPMTWEAAVDEARSVLRERWSTGVDGPLSASLSVGLFFYRLQSHFKWWEQSGFPPGVGVPGDAEQALRELGGTVYTDTLVKALQQSRESARLATDRLREAAGRAGNAEHELQRVQAELQQVRSDYERTIGSRGWVALERARRARRLARRAAGRVRRRVSRAAARPLIGSAPAPAAAYQPPAPGEADAALIAAALEFPDVDAPVVSIVIPVFNQVGYTATCLRSISDAAPTIPYEVIVVDDCSTDATAQLLHGVPGLRLLRNQRNLGFCETVNNGAAAARGEFLVLLNNDTEVRPAWLETLVDAAGSAPDVGAVGSKLLYGDGTLQEAGGIVWNTGGGWNFGRNDDPAKPVYNFRREVDYCSAASLLVRRELFEKLGRFDLRFAPGYYEDTDLCFALRELGYRVLYEPHSEVVHHEGRTYGTDDGGVAVGEHTKQSQYRNREKFVAKWSAVLSRQLPEGTAGGLLGGRRDDRLRVLVLDSWVPAHDQDSGSLRMTWILRLLVEMGCRVTLYPQDRTPRQPYTAEFQRRGVEVFHGPWTFRDLADPRPDFYDVVMVSRAMVAEELMDQVRTHFPSAVVVYDTVDLHFVREGRRLDMVGSGEAEAIERTRTIELRAIRAADITAAITPTEAQTIAEVVPGSRVVVLPNVHEIPEAPRPAFGARSDLLFIGGFDHDPNVDAVHQLVREILPRIRETVPARLWVVGSKPPPEIAAYHGDEVVVTGFLEDVAEYFRMARVFVAPLRYGAGMKGKIGHALSMGLPTVTSTIGAEGMGLEDGRHALIRDDPMAFAAAVVQLYQDRETWETLSREGLELVRREWTPEAMRSRLETLMAETVRHALPGATGLSPGGGS